MTHQRPVEKIQLLCCEHFRVKRNEMLSPRRNDAIAFPRQVAMYLARELTVYSLPQIGRAFLRDHSTVIHATRKIASMLTRDEKLRGDVELLRARLEAQLPPVEIGA